MKVQITHLKAPWPVGADIGSIVAFDGALPAWAVGKCRPAADDVQAEFTYEPPPPAAINPQWPHGPGLGAHEAALKRASPAARKA